MTNPVIIFALVLLISLFAPIIFQKIKVPQIIGLIIAGVIIGPHGFNLLLRDNSIVLFGTVGLLYIMFTAGLEIDIEQFKKNTFASILFGLITFVVPMTIGYFVGYYMLRYTFFTSLLMGGMFASHTLLAYPIVRSYQITRDRSVTLTIGGTIVADILALLVLAAVTGMTKGEMSSAFWIQLAGSTVAFGAVVLFGFPVVARWFFKKYEDPVSLYTFVLAMVFLGAFLAELAGLEAIIGAFIAGLALNKFIPHSSSLMNRIEFVGNAIFIPFFLISVGMLVDFSVLFSNLNAVLIAAVMSIVAVGSKYLSALVTQGVLRLNPLQRQLIFGLSTARVGATLAIVLVGFNIIVGESPTGEPLRLISYEILNGTVIMILCTCTVSSFVVERAARKLALTQEAPEADITEEKILLSLAYTDTVNDLIDLGLMLRPRKGHSQLYALNVVSEGSSNDKRAAAKKIIGMATRYATSLDQSIVPITRFDVNVSNGITYTLRQYRITNLVVGLHRQANAGEFLGPVAEGILKNTAETVFIYKSLQPINTFRRLFLVVTQRAEFEPGFDHWVTKVTQIAREAALPLEIFCDEKTTGALANELKKLSYSGKVNFNLFDNWEDFLILSKYFKQDDLMIIVSSRKGHVSYHHSLARLPYFLSRYFQATSFIMLYPQQLQKDPGVSNVQYVDSSIAQSVASVGKTAGLFRKIFRARRS